jgi:redox-sensitive bicupin YhaK (pirin superfamily)
MSGPELQLIDSRAEIVGDGLPIHRALPSRLRRMVGPWCFLDHMGPTELAQSGPLHVGPHPHIGLQTVTWLLDGEILHRDSLGSLQPIRPGQLNVMTAGRGISHSEESPAAASGRLHGVQFWIALPDAARQVEPMFDHYPELPVIEQDGLRLTLIVGDWLGRQSPARHFSPTLGVDVEARADSRTTLPLRDDFEYAVFLLGGSAEIEGQPLDRKSVV